MASRDAGVRSAGLPGGLKSLPGGQRGGGLEDSGIARFWRIRALHAGRLLSLPALGRPAANFCQHRTGQTIRMIYCFGGFKLYASLLTPG